MRTERPGALVIEQLNETAEGAAVSAEAGCGVRRVAVLGAECTGKSQLCGEIARSLPGLTFNEVLRDWVSINGRTPNAEEQFQLFARQQEAEEQAVIDARRAGFGWVICDSAPLMTAVYSLYYFSDDRLIEGALAHHAVYTRTLVCEDDIAWEPDPGQRDGESVRKGVQVRLLEVVRQYCPQAVFVHGSGRERLNRALAGLASQ